MNTFSWTTRISGLIILFFMYTIVFSSCCEKSKTGSDSINWPEYLAGQDPVWDTLHSYYYDGPMTGNGLIGTVIHRMDKSRFDGDTNKILFEIYRADLIDSCERRPEGYHWGRIAVGRFEFKPAGIIQKMKFRIDLWNALITGEIQTTRGLIKIKNYTHATRHVIVTEIETSGNESAENWNFFADNCGCMITLGGLDYQEKGTYSANPAYERKTTGEIQLHHQKLQNSGRDFTVAWTSKNTGNKTIYYSTIEYSHPEKAEPFQAVDILKDCLSADDDVLFNSHTSWWHNFYPKSFVSVPDAQMNNYYWIQRYVTGCTLRADLQMMDLQGPWYAHTVWFGIWWNLNTQFIYSHLLSSNNLEAALPLFNKLDEKVNSLILNVPAKYRNNSAGIGRATSYDLLSEVNPDDSIPPYYNRETGNLTWVLHNYYEYCLYSMDTNRLKEKFFPLLKRSVNLYINLAFQDSDGKYHLPISMSPEYKPAKDCNYDLSLFRWGLQTLIAVSERFNIRDSESENWKVILDNLTDYPTNETGLMIGKDTALVSAHRHFSHLLMIYPLGILTGEQKKNEDLIRKSIQHWITMSGRDKGAWSYSWAAGAYAYLGDGQMAYENLQNFFLYADRKNYWDIPGIGDNTMYREVGSCSETPFSFIKSLNDMLLQSQNGIIKIFPAIPDEWKNLSFLNLRTEGAFLVSAIRNDGMTKFFSIESLAGETCIIKSDIPVKIIRNSNNIKINRITDFSFEIHLEKGQKVSFYRNDCEKPDIQPVQTIDNKTNTWGSKLL